MTRNHDDEAWRASPDSAVTLSYRHSEGPKNGSTSESDVAACRRLGPSRLVRDRGSFRPQYLRDMATPSHNVPKLRPLALVYLYFWFFLNYEFHQSCHAGQRKEAILRNLSSGSWTWDSTKITGVKIIEGRDLSSCIRVQHQTYECVLNTWITICSACRLSRNTPAPLHLNREGLPVVLPLVAIPIEPCPRVSNIHGMHVIASIALLALFAVKTQMDEQ